VTKSAVLLSACTLAHTSGTGCAWCGAELPKRRRTWCSDRCGDAFWNNHWWSLARRAAKRRDKYCCRRCGERAPKRPIRANFTREKAYKDAIRTWRQNRKSERLEVNHIVPAAGNHRQLSCLHHLNNLETLCVRCHRVETDKLARSRRKKDKAVSQDAVNSIN